MRVRGHTWFPQTLLLGILLGVPGGSDAQQPTSTPTIRGDGFEVQFGGLVQTQFNTTSVDSVQNETELLLRRVWLTVDVRLGESLSGRIKPELGGDEIELEEAFLLLTFNPAFQFLAGKADRPFGIVDAIEAAYILPIERGAQIRGRRSLDLYRIHEQVAYAGRSVGLQLLGEPANGPLGLSYAVGYFKGNLGEEGPDPETDIKQLAGRVSVQPMGKLKLGAALTSREFIFGEGFGDTIATPGRVGETERGSAYALDAGWGDFDDPEPGPRALLEYSAGVLDPFTDAEFSGFQTWIGYRSPLLASLLTSVEPLIRISGGDLEGPLSTFGGVLVTPGLNLYLGESNRVMLNYDIWRSEDGESDAAFRAQFQLAF